MTRTPTHELLFSYGALTDESTMLGRAPNAEPLGRALLPDWQQTFRVVADIRPAPGWFVVGGCWSVPDAEFGALDVFEGLASGLYFRQLLPVLTDVGERWAWAYSQPPATDPAEYGPPSDGYLATIRDGLRQFGQPTAHLDRAVREARA